MKPLRSAGPPVYVHAALAALLLLAGCYADLDWRELRPPGSGFSAMLPGRIVEESRPLAPGLVLRQWSSRARQSLFAVGYADTPSVPLAAFRDPILANIRGRIDAERDVKVDGVAGRETLASGSASGGPVMLRLRLFAKGTRVYQVMLIGRPGDLTDDEVESFFGSFRLREPAQP